jgi:hypothetical protein
VEVGLIIGVLNLSVVFGIFISPGLLLANNVLSFKDALGIAYEKNQSSFTNC